MKYPGIPGGSGYRVTVPRLDGGVNLHDGVAQVEDNQLTACENMWWKDGMLRTRPGVRFGGEPRKMPVNAGSDAYHVYDADPGQKREALRYVVNPAGENKLFVSSVEFEGDMPVRKNSHLFSLTGGGNAMLVPSTGFKLSDGTVCGSMVFLSTLNQVWAQKGTGANAPWVNVTDEAYVPLVMVNAYPSLTLNVAEPSGIKYEGYNLLNTKFKCTYSSDGKNKYYWLPIKNFKNYIYFTRQMSDGDIEDLTLQYLNKETATGYIDNDMRIMKLTVNFNGGYFYFHSLLSNEQPEILGSGVRNNISAITEKRDIKTNTIFNMRFNTWFGGDRSGINGGTRLFVSGNPEHPNLIHWSDTNNPLYFPENNYAYIGDAGSAVTAFGRQGDKLVIFKENEMYYATYVAGQAYTAEDVMEGRVSDVTVMSAKFPITPLHASVGCDCPDTVALVNNRLIWATSDRKVYILTGDNQFSQSNVMELSRPIGRELRKFSAAEMREARAFVYGDCYMLVVGDKAFVLDCRDNAFLYYTSNNASNKAERRIPWFVWDFSALGARVRGLLHFPDADFLYLDRQEGMNYFSAYARLEGHEDSRLTVQNGTAAVGAGPIECAFTTKVFDFGAPERFKDVRQVYVGMGSEGDYDVDVTYLSEKGSYTDAPLAPLEKPRDQDDPAHIAVRRLTPGLRKVLRFGLRVASRGAIAVENLVIKYLVNGGTAR